MLPRSFPQKSNVIVPDACATLMLFCQGAASQPKDAFDAFGSIGQAERSTAVALYVRFCSSHGRTLRLCRDLCVKRHLAPSHARTTPCEVRLRDKFALFSSVYIASLTDISAERDVLGARGGFLANREGDKVSVESGQVRHAKHSIGCV